eukprot:CAMPEP_0171588646 /NCGR_PEP_ID=MMETSP0961-20121227/14258_1 /TAXON_ID=87120 /ORGANISM="Aurantiochytrium limacinum, Strain ATCCMYA-1381" /LENGTH=1180 /DNA_ID=CAMNT_0012147555 /DNA_START=428 /DNA_END=3970 /DNA_ORIENTATION=+
MNIAEDYLEVGNDEDAIPEALTTLKSPQQDESLQGHILQEQLRLHVQRQQEQQLQQESQLPLPSQLQTHIQTPASQTQNHVHAQAHQQLRVRGIAPMLAPGTLDSPCLSDKSSWFGSPESSSLRRRRSSLFGSPGSAAQVELSPAGRALLRGAAQSSKKVLSSKRLPRRSDRLFVTGDPEDLRHMLHDVRVLHEARSRAKLRADNSLQLALEEIAKVYDSKPTADPEILYARERIEDLAQRFLNASVLESDHEHHTKLVEIVEEILQLKFYESRCCAIFLFAVAPYTRRALAIDLLTDEDQKHSEHLAMRNLCSSSCDFDLFTPPAPCSATPDSPHSTFHGASDTETLDDPSEYFERELAGFNDRLSHLQTKIESKQRMQCPAADTVGSLTPGRSIPPRSRPSRSITSTTATLSLPAQQSSLRHATNGAIASAPVSAIASNNTATIDSSGSIVSITGPSSTVRLKGVRCRICEEVIPRSLAAIHFKNCLESYKDIYKECRLESLLASLKRARTRTRAPEEIEVISFEEYAAIIDLIAAGINYIVEARAGEDNGLSPHSRRQILGQAQESLANVLDSLGKSPAYSSLKALTVEALDLAIAQSSNTSHRRNSSVTKRPPNPSPKEFDFTKVISRGSVGRVFLAVKRRTGDVYAVKVMDKAEVMRKNLAARIVAERNVMARAADCPFVVKLYFSFETRTRLFLAMEFVQGGDILSLLNTYGVIPEGAVRWYASEIVVALKYLHEQLNVCHRDLKPDNILIGRDGHIKLTDFGLSHIGIVQGLDASTGKDLLPPSSASSSGYHSDSVIDQENYGSSSSQGRRRALTRMQFGKTHRSSSPSAHAERRRLMRSQVGTPDYMAPEILLGTGHGFACDWWSLGIIIYEMLFGMPPFNDETPQRIFNNILSGKLPPEEARAPVTASDLAWDLLDGLLQTNANKRLGNEGAAEIQGHPFFEGIKWTMLESGNFEGEEDTVPFIPRLDSEVDTKYFANNADVAEECVQPNSSRAEDGRASHHGSSSTSNNSVYSNIGAVSIKSNNNYGSTNTVGNEHDTMSYTGYTSTKASPNNSYHSGTGFTSEFEKKSSRGFNPSAEDNDYISGEGQSLVMDDDEYDRELSDDEEDENDCINQDDAKSPPPTPFPEINFAFSQVSNLQKLNIAAAAEAEESEENSGLYEDELEYKLSNK